MFILLFAPLFFLTVYMPSFCFWVLFTGEIPFTGGVQSALVTEGTMSERILGFGVSAIWLAVGLWACYRWLGQGEQQPGLGTAMGLCDRTK